MADQGNHDVPGLPAESPPKCRQYLAADPSDKLLWRKAPLRLEAETIRDSMLKVSGLLNERMFGKQEPIKRGPDGQWLEDDKQGELRIAGEPVSGADAHALRWRFLHASIVPDMTSDNQPERFRVVAAHAVAGTVEQSAGVRTSKAFTQQVLEKAKGNYDEAVTAGVRRGLQPRRPPRENWKSRRSRSRR